MRAETETNAVMRLKNGKACGLEVIYSEMLKNGTRKYLKTFIRMGINRIVKIIEAFP